MASITTPRRNALPAHKFGLPATRQYPVDTCARAANAKARATQQYNAGNLSAGQRAQINAKANAKLKTC
jgi:hypothetical protein